MIMALIGTTITPFMQVYVQSSVVEKRMDVEDLALVRADVDSRDNFCVSDRGVYRDLLGRDACM